MPARNMEFRLLNQLLLIPSHIDNHHRQLSFPPLRPNCHMNVRFGWGNTATGICRWGKQWKTTTFYYF